MRYSILAVDPGNGGAMTLFSSSDVTLPTTMQSADATPAGSVILAGIELPKPGVAENASTELATKAKTEVDRPVMVWFLCLGQESVAVSERVLKGLYRISE